MASKEMEPCFACNGKKGGCHHCKHTGYIKKNPDGFVKTYCTQCLGSGKIDRGRYICGGCGGKGWYFVEKDEMMNEDFAF